MTAMTTGRRWARSGPIALVLAVLTALMLTLGAAALAHSAVDVSEAWRVDEVTRVQREQGTGSLFTTHTVKDLQAFDSMEDRQRAMGFLDRARVKVCFPLPEDEASLMEGKVNLNEKEAATLAEWATTPRGVDDPVVEEVSEEDWADGVRPDGTETNTVPPGMGKFLIKEGEQPGIPVQMRLTPAERKSEVHNTNKRFARGRGDAKSGAAA